MHVKPRLLAKGFLLSLSYNYYPAQNRLLRLFLESGNPFQRAKILIHKALKANKAEAFIDAISRTISLNDREKRMIKADTYVQLAFYEKAWEAISTVSATEGDFLSLKEKILFQMRNVDDYIVLLEENNVESVLTEREKNEFLSYASLKAEWSKWQRLAEELGNKSSILLKHSRGNHELDPDGEVDLTQQLENLPEAERLYALSSSLQKNESNIDTYKQLIHTAITMNQNQGTAFLPNNTFLHDLYEADIALQKQETIVAFHKLIDAYEKGERSLLLQTMLYMTLKQQAVGEQHEHRLARLIDNGFIDVMSNQFINVLHMQDSYVSLYQYVNLENVSNERLHSFIKTIDESQVNKLKIVESLINVFYHYDYELPIKEETFTLLDQMASTSAKYAVVKGKWRIDAGQNESIVSIVEKSGNRFWVYMQLIDYAYEKEKYGLSLLLANKASELRANDPFLIRKLASIHHRIGNLSEKLKFLKRLRLFVLSAFKTEYEIAKDEVLLHTKLWEWAGNPESIKGESGILHVLNKSLPEINGYTIRSKEIVQHQRNLGLEPMVVTKLGWPARPKVNHLEAETIDGVDHYRLYTPKNKIRLNVVPLSDYFNEYANEFIKLLNKVKPKIVHAASNFQNALPALVVAKKVGIPTVYEVRGLWQDSTASKIPEFDESERYYMQQKYELYCCEIADRVVAIGDSLANHLVKLGIDRDKIDIVPNGVDAKVFYPQEANQSLVQKYDLEQKTVYGFIGSITKYEGLSDLLHAFALLQKDQPNIHFLLVGDGPALPRLRELVKTLDLSDIVSFVGRVPHTEVKDYYSVIDIFPFPRINAKVCRLVTPLKPFEVMAMGKLALVSNIPALNEMVKEKETGLVFEAENIDSLKACLAKAPDFKELGLTSREWVEKNRDWSILSKRYVEIYQKLGETE
jgi:PEP-CTERM/exosortase A-associated glycosyltransferase